MANHISHQRMDEELKKFLKRLYPQKTMANATKQLADDLWDDVVFGKRIKTKYKNKFKEVK